MMKTLLAALVAAPLALTGALAHAQSALERSGHERGQQGFHHRAFLVSNRKFDRAHNG